MKLFTVIADIQKIDPGTTYTINRNSNDILVQVRSKIFPKGYVDFVSDKNKRITDLTFYYNVAITLEQWVNDYNKQEIERKFNAAAVPRNTTVATNELLTPMSFRDSFVNNNNKQSYSRVVEIPSMRNTQSIILEYQKPPPADPTLGGSYATMVGNHPVYSRTTKIEVNLEDGHEPHAPKYICTIYLNGQKVEVVYGYSKKEAKEWGCYRFIQANKKDFQ